MGFRPSIHAGERRGWPLRARAALQGEQGASLLKTKSHEDPLQYLPRKTVQKFPKRHIIYDNHHPSANFFVVMLGRVKVTTTAEDGLETIARIVCAEGLFGEAALIGTGTKPRRESAVALDHVALMSWTREEVEQQIDREPRLGIALAQYIVRQCMELKNRIEMMAVCKTPEKVMLSLVQLAHTLGSPLPDGSCRLEALTHHSIAEYVGTSREIVTFEMNRLRRQGLVRYSRKFIDVNAEAMKQVLARRPG